MHLTLLGPYYTSELALIPCELGPRSLLSRLQHKINFDRLLETYASFVTLIKAHEGSVCGDREREWEKERGSGRKREGVGEREREGELEREREGEREEEGGRKES